MSTKELKSNHRQDAPLCDCRHETKDVFLLSAPTTLKTRKKVYKSTECAQIPRYQHITSVLFRTGSKKSHSVQYVLLRTPHFAKSVRL